MVNPILAAKVLGEFRARLITLQRTPYDDLLPPEQVAKRYVVKSLLSQLKGPARRWITLRTAPADLDHIIKSLLHLATKNQGRFIEAEWLRDKTKLPTKPSQLRNRRLMISKWAYHYVDWLQTQLITRQRPDQLVAAGVRELTLKIPDWYWRIDKAACEAGTAIADQLLSLKDYPNATEEAKRRLSERLGVNLARATEKCPWEWLNGLRSYRSLGQQPANLALLALWWDEAVRLRAQNGPPMAPLGSLVPVLHHDLAGRKFGEAHSTYTGPPNDGSSVLYIELGPGDTHPIRLDTLVVFDRLVRIQEATYFVDADRQLIGMTAAVLSAKKE